MSSGLLVILLLLQALFFGFAPIQTVTASAFVSPTVPQPDTNNPKSFQPASNPITSSVQPTVTISPSRPITTPTTLGPSHPITPLATLGTSPPITTPATLGPSHPITTPATLGPGRPITTTITPSPTTARPVTTTITISPTTTARPRPATAIRPTNATTNCANPTSDIIFCDDFPNTSNWTFPPDGIDGGQATWIAANNSLNASSLTGNVVAISNFSTLGNYTYEMDYTALGDNTVSGFGLFTQNNGSSILRFMVGPQGREGHLGGQVYMAPNGYSSPNVVNQNIRLD